MKRTLFSLSLLALLASCANDDVLDTSDFITNVLITADDVQMAESESYTRTDLTLASGVLQFAWAAEDVVGIYPNEGDQVSFPMTKGAGTKSANFDGGGWAVKSSCTYAAYFPYDAGNTYYGRSYTALPLSYTGQRQTANSSTAHLGDYDYMVATASAPSNGSIAFNFTHLNSFLYIQLTTPDAATFTKLTLATDDDLFVEEATVNIATGVITPTETSESLVLDLNNIAVAAGGTLYAWMAVAPADLSSKTLTATLTTSDGTNYKTEIAGKKYATGRAYVLKSTVASEGTGGSGEDIPFGDDDDHAYVDLGLPSGLLWATCNVGAKSPEDYGDYFAWGETETQSNNSYSWSSYKWCNGSSSSMTKYCTDSSYGIVDNKTVLEAEDDVAHVKWGGNWRMPMMDELNELCAKCTWTWTQVNGVDGYKVSSKQPGNTNFIFLPAAGYRHDGSLSNVGSCGDYWSSSLYLDDFLNHASGLHFVSAVNWVGGNRYYGRSVRPVYDDTLQPQHEYVDLGLPSGIKWATCNVGAENPEDYGDYFAWGETETKDTYNWSTYKWCNGSSTTMTKYCRVDNKTVLDPEDDVAHVKWGGNWRMPTRAEQDELRTKCNWTWMQVNGVNGYDVTGPNGNSMFLPAAGCRSDGSLGSVGSYGCYWSSFLYTGTSRFAFDVDFFSSYYDMYNNSERYCGQSVRPVCAE